MPFSENDPNQVVGTGRVVSLLHLWSDLVVRLRDDLGQIDPCRVVAERAKRVNVCHVGGERNCSSAARPGARMQASVGDFGQTFAASENQICAHRLDDKVLTVRFSGCGSILTQYEDFL